MNNILIRKADYGEDFAQGESQQIFAGSGMITPSYNDVDHGIQCADFENVAPPGTRVLAKQAKQMVDRLCLPDGRRWASLMGSETSAGKADAAISPHALRETLMGLSDPEALERFLEKLRMQMAMFMVWQSLQTRLRGVRGAYPGGGLDMGGASSLSSFGSVAGSAPVEHCHHPGDVRWLPWGDHEGSSESESPQPAERFPFPEPAYGFVGRELELMAVEKRLASRNNLLLLRGVGGTGKTLFLKYLAAWWQTTRFVDHVFYFGYDERLWTAREILSEIAGKLLTPSQRRVMRPDALQAVVREKLREERHLVILDQLEAVSGAGHNALPEEELRSIRDFLSGLKDGKTLVMLGSRGDETWFGRRTFFDNAYELSGLDSQSAFKLGSRILKACDRIHYRKDPGFEKLLGLLGGHPLAMEIVLGDLRDRAPRELLNALDHGKDAEGESHHENLILRAVEFVHRTPLPKGLLPCLAMFAPRVNPDGLGRYGKYLRNQPALEHLPFDGWDRLIREGVHRELLEPDPRNPEFLRIHPVLSYFLKARLNASPEPERRAVETGFRRYYDNMSRAASAVLRTTPPSARKEVARVMLSPEYENLNTALDLALKVQASPGNLYRAIAAVPGPSAESRRALETRLLAGLAGYGSDRLQGRTGAKWVEVLNDIGRHQLLSGRYAEAETTYRKALRLWLGNTLYDTDQIRRKSGAIYHQLGRAAQEQGQWKRAAACFLKDLEIANHYKDRQGVALTLRNLFRLWHTSGDQELPKAIASVMGWAV